VKHRREEKEIVAADKRDLHVLIRADRFFEMKGRVNPAKPPAEQ